VSSLTAIPSATGSAELNAAPALRRQLYSADAPMSARWLNLTFMLYAVILTLTLIGVCAVYTSSAAIVASRENKARLRREKMLAERGIETARESRTLSGASVSVPERFAELPKATSFHSSSFLKKQIAWALMGLVGLFVAYRINYRHWRKFAFLGLIGTVFLLLMVFVPGIGRTINGSSRWIGVGPITLQPSELAKLAMVLFMANRLTVHQHTIRRFWRGFVPHVMILGGVCLLIVKEPDLGATACVGLIVYVMLYAAGANIKHLILLAAMALPVLAMELMVPYRRARLLAFLDPEKYYRTHAWQLNQSLIAIGSGGVDGQGLGFGPQKYHFLSTAFSDFIYAVIAEETGLLGAGLIILLYLALFTIGWMIAWRAPDLNGTLIAVGITCMFTLSAFIHMFVNTGLVPTKGLTLPFVSAGGSSLFINMVAAGILMNVAKMGEIQRTFGVVDRDQWDDDSDGTPDQTTPHDDASFRVRLTRGGQSREYPLPGDLPSSPSLN
jgi:cell division protein FtsW